MSQQNQIFQVFEDEKKEAVLEILSDKYCVEILRHTMNSPKSAVEISDNLKIPLSSVYRRIPLLREVNMLSMSGKISPEGKKYFLYRNKIKKISTKSCEGKIDVKFTHY